MTYIFFIFLAYLLYRLVFHFIIPIYRTTRRVKQGFREMHQRMHSTETQQPRSGKKSKEQNKRVGDYIDFEEVK